MKNIIRLNRKYINQLAQIDYESEHEFSRGIYYEYEELKKGNKILTLDTLGGKEAVRFLEEQISC